MYSHQKSRIGVNMEPTASLTLENIWIYLQSIAADPANPARVMTLANADQHGQPQVRSVILREVEPWALTIYTDSRSPKVVQLTHDSRAQLLLWDAQRRWQLRCSAQSELINDTARLDRLWQRISATPAAQDYLGPQAPGTPVDGVGQARTEPALAILRFRVTEVDWLALDRAGHSRQRLTPTRVQALVP